MNTTSSANADAMIPIRILVLILVLMLMLILVLVLVLILVLIRLLSPRLRLGPIRRLLQALILRKYDRLAAMATPGRALLTFGA